MRQSDANKIQGVGAVDPKTHLGEIEKTLVHIMENTADIALFKQRNFCQFFVKHVIINLMHGIRIQMNFYARR